MNDNQNITYVLNRVIGTIIFILGLYYHYKFKKDNMNEEIFHLFFYSISAIGLFINVFSYIEQRSKRIQNGTKILINTKNQIKEEKQEIQLSLKNEYSHNKIFQKLQKNRINYQLANLKIKKIYKIHNLKLKQQFNEFIENHKYQHLQGYEDKSNTNLLLHGTTFLCSLQNQQPCSNKDCSLCNIINNGFSVKYAGKGQSMSLRYGQGIYFTNDIDKSLNYCNSNKNEFAVLISKVSLGKVLASSEGEDYLNNGQKYDSIYGSPFNQADLSHNEVCIMNEKACIPLYILIIY